MRIPDEPHYAILVERTIHVPGDERSRTNPGHGYPAYDEVVTDYQVYLNRSDWEAAITKLASLAFPTQYKALWVTPAKVTAEVKVTVEIKLQER